jgi:hypothetical protein
MQTDGRIVDHTVILTNEWAKGQTDRQTDKQTNRQADKQTSRQADKQTSRQADIPMCTYTTSNDSCYGYV